VDDLDKTLPAYRERYGDEVVVFDKRAIAKTFDQGDNFADMRAIIYARNASFGVARSLGFRRFVELDDDYTGFAFRFNGALSYCEVPIKSLDATWAAICGFQDRSGADAVAMAQNGDYLGGKDTTSAERVELWRKCMNSFFCRTDRPFRFVGRINEDANTYTRAASTGLLMFTANQVSLRQGQTQKSSGGMTELYLASGTYVKSFYSVMYSPSSVRIVGMRSAHSRLHHRVKWEHAVPLIVHEPARRPLDG
jgi:hypothetical protein